MSNETKSIEQRTAGWTYLKNTILIQMALEAEYVTVDKPFFTAENIHGRLKHTHVDIQTVRRVLAANSMGRSKNEKGHFYKVDSFRFLGATKAVMQAPDGILAEVREEMAAIGAAIAEGTK